MLDEAVVTAGDMMTHDVAVVHPETSLMDAVKLMASRRISGMPVTDHAGTIVGMLSEGDLVRWHDGFSTTQMRWLDMLAEGNELAPSFIEAIRAEQYKVKTAMSPGAFTITEDVAARDVAALMYAKGIKRVPVVRDGKLVGIVARSDLIRALANDLTEHGAQAEAMHRTVDEALRRRREEAGKPQSDKAAHTR